MTSKTGQAGNPDASSSTSAKKGAAVDASYDIDATDPDKGSPAPSELESKQKALADLQAQEKQLVAEIAGLRTLQTDVAAFESQIKATSDALERERKDLQTFASNELKALDAKTRTAIVAVAKDVDATIAKTRSDYDDAVKRTKSAADAVEKSAADLIRAEAAYSKIKQGAAEAKRVLGELKTLKKEAQAAEGRNEFAVAGYWLLELERRLPDAELPDKAALTSAWDELGRKRKAAEDAKRDADAAKADEAVRRKARDEAEKNREVVILERLTSQSEAQKPETAA